MALIVGIPNQALDANGEVMPFAELHTFDADAPTTPKVTYSDPGLTVEHPNPVAAGDDGYFPQMFAASSESFYVAFTTQNGDPDVPFKAYQQVQASGADEATTFAQIFPDARLEITSAEVEPGVDGVVVRAGKPSPQNTGGALKDEGWNGTQLDQRIIDAADTRITGNVTIDGSLNVGGTYTTPYARVTDRQTLTGVTTITIPLDPTYESYEIRIQNLIWTTNGDYLTARVSFDGSTYKSGAGDYVWEMFYYSAGTATAASSSGTVNLARLTPQSPGSTPNGSEVIVKLFSKSGAYTRMLTSFVHGLSGTGLRVGQGGAIVENNTYGKATHMQISLGGSGPISADVIVYGIPTTIA